MPGLAGLRRWRSHRPARLTLSRFTRPGRLRHPPVWCLLPLCPVTATELEGGRPRGRLHEPVFFSTVVVAAAILVRPQPGPESSEDGGRRWLGRRLLLHSPSRPLGSGHSHLPLQRGHHRRPVRQRLDASHRFCRSRAGEGVHLRHGTDRAGTSSTEGPSPARRHSGCRAPGHQTDLRLWIDLGSTPVSGPHSAYTPLMNRSDAAHFLSTTVQ